MRLQIARQGVGSSPLGFTHPPSLAPAGTDGQPQDIILALVLQVNPTRHRRCISASIDVGSWRGDAAGLCLL